MSSFSLHVELHGKPGIHLSGFLCFVLLAATAEPFEYPLTAYLEYLWFRSYTSVFPAGIDDSLKSSAVSVYYTYNDIYHERREKEGAEVSHAAAQTYCAGIDWVVDRPAWGIKTSCVADGYFGAWVDASGTGAIRGNQDIRQMTVSAWARNGSVAAGVGLGSFTGEDVRHTSAGKSAAEHPLLRLNNTITLDYAGFIRVAFRGLRAEYSTSRNANQASFATYRLFSTDNFRTFPCAAATISHVLDLSFHHARSRIGLRGALREIYTDTVVERDNAMPVTANFALREVGVFADLGNAIPRVSTECTYSGGGGYLTGYYESFRYVIFNDITFRRLHGSMHCTLPFSIFAGLFGDYIRAGNEESGYFHMAPFSAWAVFDPSGYRFSAVRFGFYEAGLFTGKTISPGRRNSVELDCSFSRTAGSLSYIREEKRVVTLIPVYVNDTAVTVFDFIGWNLSVGLGHLFRYKRWIVESSIHQRIPLWNDLTGATRNASDSGGRRVVHGGTACSFMVRYQAGEK
jgi:hypothetical protein